MTIILVILAFVMICLSEHDKSDNGDTYIPLAIICGVVAMWSYLNNMVDL